MTMIPAVDLPSRADSPPRTRTKPALPAVDAAFGPGADGRRRGRVGANAFEIVTTDVMDGLAALPDGSVDLCVTSPPYFWQRDYGVEGQIGHEPTVPEYVDGLVRVFAEVRRVLRDDGVLFLNLGDAYYNAKGRPHGSDRKHAARQMARQRLRAVDGPGLGFPRKSLLMLPARVAIGMQDSGWTLRSSIIWHRPKSLAEPTSHDRPWRTHENLYLFSKGPRYFYDRTKQDGEEDVWTIDSRPNNPYAHCAPFPEKLVERCVGVGSRPGGTVLDPFLGSGTTMTVALRMGRGAVGLELNDDFAAMSLRRVVSELAAVPVSGTDA